MPLQLSSADVYFAVLQRPQAPASASAHKAATQAFLSSRASQANLSASAAAQALRTLTPTPTPVDQVQTKRMVQRQASSGSLNSARGRGRGGLQRQNSAGSMTERTFRTPSPSPSRQPSRSGPQPPPIPTIPQQFATPSPQGPVKKKKKRATSQEAPPPRVLSPPLTRPHNRGQSLDRFGAPQQEQPPAPSFPQNNTIPENNDLERVDSRNSINFSRPLSPRPQSPMAQSPAAHSPVITNGDRSAYNGAATNIPPVQAATIQHDLIQTANKPVKKKKKKVAAGATEGSHLHTGTLASKPIVTPLEPGPPPQAQAPLEQQPPVKKKKKRTFPSGESTHFPATESPRTDSDSDSNVEHKREKRAQRASGMLQKQPSIVREDWEGEQQQESTPPQVQQSTEPPAQDTPTPVQDKRPINTANVSKKIEEPGAPSATTNHSPSPQIHAITTPDVPRESPASANYLNVAEPQTVRGSSLSPSRSTRFSDRLSSDMAAGVKHEPPPRSISPAKPALKHHSPAPAMYGADGTQIRGSSVTPSESSDMSSVSADGPPKRKKSVRVSFDAQPEIVNPPANDQSPVSSPGKERKSWLGLGKSKPALNTIPSNGDLEELMKPRPQLPSFGSVRGQKFRDMNDSNATQASRAPPPAEAKIFSQSATSSESSSTSAPYSAPGVSNDHAVGAILAQEAQRVSDQKAQLRSDEPLPPEVTSVHGMVSFSDEESNTSDTEEAVVPEISETNQDTFANAQSKTLLPAAIDHQITAPAQSAQAAQEVPEVSVSPPTPAEESRPADQYLVEVPGGFPVSAEGLAMLDESNKAERATRAAETDDEDEDGSDNDSIYSDAAEDPSELEGMGFGSIDAILESPLAPPPALISSPPESPLAHISMPRPQQPPRTASWEETQARWSDIAQQTRQAPPQEVPQEKNDPAPKILSSAPEPARPQQQSQPAPAPASQPRRKKKSPAAIAAAASVPAAFAASQGLPDSPPRKRNQTSAYPAVEVPNLGHAAAAAAPFRHSMRASSPPDADPGLRKTMRNEGRKSMPPPATVALQQRVAQPAPAATQPSRAAQQKKPMSLATAAAATAPRPRTQPAPPPVNNDSDSESSFRKARRSKSTAGGRYTMRRSMRGAAEPTLRGDGRNGIRSVSPVGRRPFSPPDASRSMRTTMRASIDTGPTLRGPPDARRSSSMFARQNRSGDLAPFSGFSSQNNRSRILDSDDEDEPPVRSKWRSRFADDSDDETDVAQLTPVRGIPRRNNDEDSTDLDDSSDEEQSTARTAPAAPRLQIPSGNVAAPASSAEALSPNSEKKRGLLGLFRSKKPKEETLSPVAESPRGPAMMTTTDTSKPSRLGFASNAERDRIIEQTRARLEASREQQHGGGQQQQGHAKLQRRHMPERIMSDSWPLPPALPDEARRPMTSDGPLVRNGTTRLNQGSMRKPNEGAEVVGRSGKKKRFPMLRKAFGLKD